MKAGSYGMVFNPYSLGLDVRNHSGNEVLVLCPYHNDKHASAEFNVTTGLFHCFTCGVSATAKQVAKKLGGTVDAEVKRIVPKAVDYNWRPLLGAPLAINNAYLLGRGVENWQIEKYGIRQVNAGIIIPLFTTSGRICGVIARRYDGQPKYQILGERPALWPYPTVVQRNPRHRLALVEGVFGFLAAERAKIEAAATLTCRASEEACSWLNRGPVGVCYDDDKAGWLGAGKVIENVPTASAVVSGVEYDMATPDQWQEIWNPSHFTRQHSRLAVLSGNPQLYYNVVKPRALRRRF